MVNRERSRFLRPGNQAGGSVPPTRGTAAVSGEWVVGASGPLMPDERVGAPLKVALEAFLL